MYEDLIDVINSALVMNELCDEQIEQDSPMYEAFKELNYHS